MIIYFPKSVLELPLIKKAAEMLNAHAEEYDIPKLDLKETVILDPVKNFLSLYLKNEEDINYFAQTFYSVKGTKKVIEFLYKYGFLNSECKVIYKSSKRLQITLRGIIKTINLKFQNEEMTIREFDRDTSGSEIDYCSKEFINRFREFLKALLYFGFLDININSLTISVDLLNNGGVFGDAELFIIEKAE